MATPVDYVEFVCEQLHDFPSVRYKKMFGEYMVYINEKPILLVCDSTVYVKKLPQLDEIMQGAQCGVPYGGAKEHYILDIENGDLTAAVCTILEEITPLPKKRNKK